MEPLASIKTWLCADPAQKAELKPPRELLKRVVRATVQAAASSAPGKAVELRVPPFGAVQCFTGVNHRRGTPPNVAEIPLEVWLKLCFGLVTWQEALPHMELSGIRAAEVEKLVPLPAASWQQIAAQL